MGSEVDRGDPAPFLDSFARQLLQQQQSLDGELFSGLDFAGGSFTSQQESQAMDSTVPVPPWPGSAGAESFQMPPLPSTRAGPTAGPAMSAAGYSGVSGTGGEVGGAGPEATSSGGTPHLDQLIAFNQQQYMGQYPDLPPPPESAPQFTSLSPDDLLPGSVQPGDRLQGLVLPGDGEDHRLKRNTSHGSSGSDHVPEEGQAEGKEAGGGGARSSQQLSRFKEKNRTAQKRYRARQKSKLQDSEERVAELAEELRHLRTEKESLATRNALLERFLAMQQQQAAAGTPSLVESEGSAWWLDSHTRQMIERTLMLSGELTFTVREGAPIKLTREQVAALPADEYGHLWREYINAYASCLVAADGDPHCPAGQRLSRLVFEAGQIKACMAMTFPDRIHSFEIHTARPMPAGTAEAAAQDQRVAQLLKAMALEAEQRRVLIMLRRVFLTNLGVLVARRRNLSSALQASLPGRAKAPGAPAAVVGTDYLRTVATMDKLRDTLRDEHSFLVQFMLTVWRRCLTPFQAANLHIQAYPRSPDLLALINCLAVEEGEPSYGDLLREGAAAGDGTALLPLDAALPALPAALSDFGIKHVAFSTQPSGAPLLSVTPPVSGPPLGV